MNSNQFSTEKSQNLEELGVIVLNSDGSISQSSGELENDSKTAKIISSIIDCIHLYESLNTNEGQFHSITIQFDDYLYSVQISKKSTVIKRKLNLIKVVET